jgi:hypothetical protein
MDAFMRTRNKELQCTQIIAGPGTYAATDGRPTQCSVFSNLHSAKKLEYCYTPKMTPVS